MRRDGEEWVRKAQEGSKKAFNKLVQKYVELIFHLLYDITGNYEDAQDLTQETFLRVFTNIRQYRGDAKFSTWLYRIAYNVGIDFKRRKRMVYNQEFQEQKMILNRFSSNEGAEYTGKTEAIDAALQRLTRPQRMAVVLHYYHGCRMREISEIVGCSEGTVRVHLFRGLRRLRDELKDFSPGD